MDQIQIKNSFNVREWTGAIGDLGTLLPLAFAIIIYTGHSPNTIFLLWGLAYLITGVVFKVPLSVQPLKVMAVIAIAHELSPEFLASTAFLYGLLFLIISLTGLIEWLEKWFSPALVTGIQLGIGLILGKKALELIFQNGLFLSQPAHNPWLSGSIFLVVLSVLLFALSRKKYATGVGSAALLGLMLSFFWPPLVTGLPAQSLDLNIVVPDLTLMLNAITFLVIPQLPLTLGNSVFAADRTCHQLWGNQAQRITPKRLGLSVGISNTFIGLLGGFPMCHGAGGMAAHFQFGARTGGATIIIGSALIILAAVPGFSNALFLIPIPILATFLFLDGWRMVLLIRDLSLPVDYATAILVGGLAFFTGNLTLALVLGLINERILMRYYVK